jgi:hypothetical protein
MTTSQSATTESVEEFLARGGKVEEIPKGKSADWDGRFNRPLKDRVKAMNAATWRDKKPCKTS